MPEHDSRLACRGDGITDCWKKQRWIKRLILSTEGTRAVGSVVRTYAIQECGLRLWTQVSDGVHTLVKDTEDLD
jgi:hypothetical protein